MERGMEQEKFHTAKNMLGKNLTIELISYVTLLSIDQIKALAPGTWQVL